VPGVTEVVSARDSDWALETEGLTRSYGSHTVVSQLDLRVARGDIYGFLGPNGAGKTTTMRMILGMIRVDAGSVRIFGQPASVAARSAVGGIIESPRFYPFLSGVENLRIFAAYSGPVDEHRIQELLEMVRLKERQDDRVKQYSLGMKQRLGIAQALLSSPEFLLLDEPTNGLDPAGIREVRDLILQLHSEIGLTVFVSSHILKEIEGFCTRVGIIQDGKMVAEGSLDDLRVGDEDLEAAFLRLTADDGGGQIR
jgi:ABC-2 type transport system ATP-binding protein